MSDAEQIEALPIPAEEHVTAVPVIPDGGALERRAVPGMVPAVQAAAAAAGGFVAGAAVVGLVHRHGRRRALARVAQRGKLLRRSGRGSRTGAGAGAELLQIVGSRSLLLDVHLLGGSAER